MGRSATLQRGATRLRRPARAGVGRAGQGYVNDIPASHWKEYLNVADHPEYPSGSSAFCAAHAQAARRFLGDDTLNWAVPVPMGSSTVEPGITPATDIVLGPWATWTEWETECGLSRLWGGVHFLDAIAAGNPIGPGNRRAVLSVREATHRRQCAGVAVRPFRLRCVFVVARRSEGATPPSRSSRDSSACPRPCRASPRCDTRAAAAE